MIVAVTGSEGFVGKELVKALLLDNHQVVEIDFSKGISVTNESDCNKIPYFDVMVHLAAKNYVPDSYNMPREFYHVNFIGTLNMLELCRKYNARFIFTSSYVYGIPHYLPIDENHPLMAFNPYADSKIKGEELCHSYQRFFNINSVIIRPFNIYGRSQQENFLISTIFNQAKNGVINLQDSKPKRDYIYIDDVIAAYLKTINNQELKSEIFNLGSGISYSVQEVTEMVNRYFNDTLKIHFSENSRPNEVMDTVANIENAKNKLNWFPSISLEEGIRRIFND